jgi:hypothetical protein
LKLVDLATGNQLHPARPGADQQQARVKVNTIINMEARGAEPITGGAITVRKVQVALEGLGIEFA